MNSEEATFVSAQAFLRCCHGLPVPVDPNEPSARRQTLENHLRMPAAAQRPIDEHAAPLGREI